MNESVKLFVGQVPKHFTEKELQEHIEIYAPIENLTILRDRTTGMHKGMLTCDSYPHVTRSDPLDMYFVVDFLAFIIFIEAYNFK